jgi:serine/threonine-protein kinase RsbW
MMIKIAQAQFPAEYHELEAIRKWVEQYALDLGLTPDVVYDLTWAITEIVTNVISHGYNELAGSVEIILWRQGKDFIMQVRDDAPVFDLNAVPEPNLALPLDKRQMGGLGLHITKKIVDSLTHRVSENGGNEITLLKRDVIQS